ncbi:aldehyde dehydrogenase family protein [Streptomyces sp. NPDC012751]|uniref:aldehyde dehydrogenase family protein n=1 Tax=Streptomyces sp. NPDC012751 TaxID=3364846 RepID=UPI0036AE835A
MSPGTAEGDGGIPAGRDARTDVWVRRVPPASSVWTRDHRGVVSVARRIGAGVVWIDCHMTMAVETPNGGCKESGTARTCRRTGWRTTRASSTSWRTPAPEVTGATGVFSAGR